MKSKVAIVKSPDYELKNIEYAVREIFSLFGGIETVVKSGEKVLLKPNLLAAAPPGDGSLTHYAFVEAVIRVLSETGVKLYIGDGPAFGSASGVAEACGLGEVARRYGVAIIEFKKNCDISRDKKFSDEVLNKFPADCRGKISRLSTVTKSVLEFDKIINLPKLKVHVQMGFTGAVKNNYGFVSGKAKTLRHFAVHNDIDLFARFILHLYSRVKPDFTLVDAVDVLSVRGPRGGVKTRCGYVIGGVDCVAIDTAALDLLGGFANDFPILQNAAKFKIGESEIADIDLSGVDHAVFPGIIFPERIPVSFTFSRVLSSIYTHILKLWFEGIFRLRKKHG